MLWQIFIVKYCGQKFSSVTSLQVIVVTDIERFRIKGNKLYEGK